MIGPQELQGVRFAARVGAAVVVAVASLSLGRPTMALAKTALRVSTSEGSLPLAGVAAFEMASYEVPGSAGKIDFTRMPIRAWEPVVKFREGSTSTLVLVRPEGEAVADLVLVAGDADRMLCSLIQGRLSRDLPEALGRAVRSGGPDTVRRELLTIIE